MLDTKLRFRRMGDRGLLVELGNEISPRVSQRVRRLFAAVDRAGINGVMDLVPAYRSLLVIHDPLIIASDGLRRRIVDLEQNLDRWPLPQPRIIRVPVVYGGKYGPDLQWVADYHDLTVTATIELHLQPTYIVYMIGFTPGFPYLGQLPKALATPRRETPRTRVVRGSVGIAQRQTGIYSVDSPGGWQILGWTPLNLFDPRQRPPSILQMGDRVKFFAITAEEAARWRP